MAFPVLVCDDSIVARKQVIRNLESYGEFEFYQACNGQEALDILQQREIGLLCLDLTMPVVDGITVLKTMRQKKIECYTLVISADIQPEMKQRVNSFDTLHFLEKPIDKAALEAVLHKFGIK